MTRGVSGEKEVRVLTTRRERVGAVQEVLSGSTTTTAAEEEKEASTEEEDKEAEALALLEESLPPPVKASIDGLHARFLLAAFLREASIGIAQLNRSTIRSWASSPAWPSS